MLPDYGLEDIGAALDDDGDTFNDDTFGDTAGWEQGNESSLEMSKLHDQFLSGDLSDLGALAGDLPLESAQAGGFFGNALEADGNDFLLEDVPTLDEFPEVTFRERPDPDV